jgi:heme a synthase
LLLVLALQLLFGAWVAGLNAGHITTHWPLMDDAGSVFPGETTNWANGTLHALTHDPYLLNFIHRWWAFVAVAALVVLARLAKAAGSRQASIAIHSAFGIQILLGIATVMTGVNIVLAVLHQAVGALVVASAAWGAHVAGQRERVTQRIDPALVPTRLAV